jgi:hypothetical protein
VSLVLFSSLAVELLSPQAESVAAITAMLKSTFFILSLFIKLLSLV